ncbi:UDP-glycosyltransferase protein [Vigna angularis]|uniref:UDP-glycosyltransferase protein n=1 Tax=Phaseolus angularis TaxID=3914 RepID=A0A8T0L028_PHAAN|nr:UDP-glycosyltransferase protein [Vigna angularis]
MEVSGHGFIWVVSEKKGKEESEEEEKWTPKGFEERNVEKWMVIRGWAPQLIILNHRAVGAFLSHCGWNSIVETEWWRPHDYLTGAREQFYKEKLISEVRGIGVEFIIKEKLDLRYILVEICPLKDVVINFDKLTRQNVQWSPKQHLREDINMRRNFKKTNNFLESP